MKYGKETILVTGVATPPKEAPITGISEVFFASFVVCRETDIIIDMSCNLIYQMPIDFIRPMLIGRNLAEDLDQMVEEIRSRFWGLSQKTLIVALKDAHNRYLTAKKNASYPKIRKMTY